MFNFWYPHIRLCAVNNSVKVDYFGLFYGTQQNSTSNGHKKNTQKGLGMIYS